MQTTGRRCDGAGPALLGVRLGRLAGALPPGGGPRRPLPAAGARGAMAGGGAGPAPPPRPAGLRREAFAESVPVLALRVPARHTQAVQRALRQSRLLLDRPRTKSVRDCAASRQHRLLLLDERLQTRPPDAPLDAADPAHHLLPAPLAAFLSDLPEAVRRFQPRPKKPKEDPPPPPAAGEEEGGGPPPRPQPEVEVEVEVVREALELGYEDYAYEQVLRRVLPEGVDVPTSFETVGHIAHLNLRDEHLPFKRLIGEVLLDKNRPRLRSVVNKVGVLESSNTFRTLPLEVIAGDADLETEVRQYGARFRLNYAEVYWNSRLEAEHRRLVEEFQPGEAVCDMMAGIGPFAVPAAMRGHRVYANDLNPRCKHYLDVNAQRNKLRAPVGPRPRRALPAGPARRLTPTPPVCLPARSSPSACAGATSCAASSPAASTARARGPTSRGPGRWWTTS